MVKDIRKRIGRKLYDFTKRFEFTKRNIFFFSEKQNLFINKKIDLNSLLFPVVDYKLYNGDTDSLKTKNLNIIQKYTLKKVLPFMDLPYIFNLAEKQLLRYSAKFFGYNYLSHMFSYTL
jgi:hypothetical protein